MGEVLRAGQAAPSSISAEVWEVVLEKSGSLTIPMLALVL